MTLMEYRIMTTMMNAMMNCILQIININPSSQLLYYHKILSFLSSRPHILKSGACWYYIKAKIYKTLSEIPTSFLPRQCLNRGNDDDMTMIMMKHFLQIININSSQNNKNNTTTTHHQPDHHQHQHTSAESSTSRALLNVASSRVRCRLRRRCCKITNITWSGRRTPLTVNEPHAHIHYIHT